MSDVDRVVGMRISGAIGLMLFFQAGIGGSLAAFEMATPARYVFLIFMWLVAGVSLRMVERSGVTPVVAARAFRSSPGVWLGLLGITFAFSALLVTAASAA